MATALDLINAALENIGVHDPGEGLSDADAQTGLTTLNRMLSHWSSQRLMLPNKVTESFSTVAGTVSYTIGDGATWDTVRPQRIEGAYIRDSDGNDHTLDIIRDRRQYDEIVDKDASQRPNRLWLDPLYPISTVYLDAAPNEAETIFLISWKVLAAFSSLTAEASFPEGYEAAIEYNLAIWLAPKFSTQPAPSVVDIANETKRVIKSFNWKPTLSSNDVPDQYTDRWGYNIYSDNYNR